MCSIQHLLRYTFLIQTTSVVKSGELRLPSGRMLHRHKVVGYALTKTENQSQALTLPEFKA